MSKLDIKKYSHPVDLFMVALSSFFMGEINNLDMSISHIDTKKTKWLIPLLNAFRFTEIKEKRQHTIIQLIHSKEAISKYPILLGDFYLSLGLLFGQLEDKQLSSESFIKSLSYYKKEKLMTHTWYAHFNYYLSKRNAGEYTKYDNERNNIIKHLSNVPKKAQVRPKWFISELLFTENDLDQAFFYLNDAIASSKSEHNKVQEYECLIEYYYMKYISGENVLIPALNHRDQHRVFTLYRELRTLVHENYCQRTTLIHWSTLKLHPLLVHRLIHIYIHQKIVQKEPLSTLEDIQYIEDNLIHRRLYIPMYDLDYYRAKSYIQLKDTQNALTIVSRIEESKKHLMSPLFNQNYLELIDALKNQQLKLVKPTIRLDTVHHILYLNKHVINLASLVILEKALEILILHSKGITIDLFFTLIYDTHYQIVLHESRLNSLIARLRSLLSNSKSLIRRSNKLILSNYTSAIITNGTHRSQSSLRKENIKKYISRENSLHYTTEIQKYLQIPLRTLQLDLKEMLDNGHIQRKRVGRRHAYFINL
jgi:hypothetical protein